MISWSSARARWIFFFVWSITQLLLWIDAIPSSPFFTLTALHGPFILIPHTHTKQKWLRVMLFRSFWCPKLTPRSKNIDTCIKIWTEIIYRIYKSITTTTTAMGARNRLVWPTCTILINVASAAIIATNISTLE